MRLLILIPLFLSIPAFVLSLLSLLAGYKQGFLEDYNVLTFNTSTLGRSTVESIVNGSSTTSLPPAVQSAAAGLTSALTNSIGDSLAEQLGIGEFYSIHAMDFCQGNFQPSAFDVNPSANVTNCSMPLDFCKRHLLPASFLFSYPNADNLIPAAYNFTDKLNQELGVGPLQFTLTDLGVGSDIQSTLNYVPKIAKALAALFIATVALTGFSMLGAIVGFLGRAGRCTCFFNLAVALGSAVFLLASALLATIGPREVERQIQQRGGADLGLGVLSNSKLARILWAAFALMAATTLFWFYELIVECVRRRRTRGWGEKPYTGSYMK